jgi:hypothetical protein
MADRKAENRNQVMSSVRTRESKYTIRPADANERELIMRFNRRLAAGGVSYRLPAKFTLPGEEQYRPAGYPIFRELMIISDEEEMHAGVLLQHGTFFIREEARPFCWLQLPLSEGLVNPAYGSAFLSLFRQVTMNHSFLASLGVGSMDEPWARFMVRQGWKHQAVPFVFYPVRPGKVFTGIEYLRRRRELRIAAKVARYSGAGTLLGAALGVRRALPTLRRRYRVSLVEGFDGWADGVFRRNQPKYLATTRKDATALNILYPPEEKRYIRLRIQAASGREIGWLLLVHAQMKDNQYFGNLHVGTLVTGFCDPADTGIVIHAGLSHLVELGADLVVANFSHKSWLGACHGLGFLPGPSNFFLFFSPGGRPLLEAACPLSEVHVTRGDCDSPASLMPTASK